MIHSRDVQFNELACGIEKETSSSTSVEYPRVIIDCPSVESSTPESLDGDEEMVTQHDDANR